MLRLDTVATTCLVVGTTSDDPSFSSFPSILPKGQVQGVSVSVLEADRVPGQPNKPLTISFTTQTDLVGGDTVTISWPPGYVTALSAFSPNAYWTGPTGTFNANVVQSPPNGAVLTVPTLVPAGTGAPMGAYVVVLLVTFGRSPGQSQAICSASSAFSVVTSKDAIGFGSYPPIGLGRVTNVQLTLSDPVPGATRREATVTFTASAPLGSSLTMSWPPGYFYGFPIRYDITGPVFGSLSGEALPLVSDSTGSPFPPWALSSRYFTGITIAPPGFGGSAGTYTVRLSNLALGGPVPFIGPLFNVNTPQNDPGSGNYPAIGGSVTSTSLFIAETDRIANAPNRRAIVRFTTSTALVCGDSISVAFPSGFFSNTPDGRAQVLASSFGVPGPVAVSSQGVNTQRSSYIFSITVNSSVPAGPQTVTLCGLTFNNFGAGIPSSCGVSVTTNKDWTTTYVPSGTIPGTIPGRVTGVSLTIPWANRIAGRSSQTVTFAFTTETQLPEVGGSITISFPPNFFVENSQSCGTTPPISAAVAGVPGYSLENSAGPSSSTQFVLRGGRLPAGPYVAIFTGVTFGTLTAGSDTGIQVQTSVDAISSGSPSGPLSGFQVTAFTLPSCVAAPPEQRTCSTASITFLSNIPTLLPGGSLVITFGVPAGGSSPIEGTPDQFITSSGALITGQFTSGSNTITLTVQAGFGNWEFFNGPNTITLAGVSIAPTFSLNAGFVRLSSSAGPGAPSTDVFSAAYFPTSFGQSVTTSMVISDPFTGVQNTQAAFSFTTMNPVRAGEEIRVVFPIGLFISTPAPTTCLPTFTPPAPLIVSFQPSSCGVLQSCAPVLTPFTSGPSGRVQIFPLGDNVNEYIRITVGNDGFLPAGPKTISFTGVNLSPTARAASNLYIVTTADACNGGSAAVAAIGPRPAPAAAAPSNELSADARNGIIGGVIGGVLAIAVILAIVFRRKIAAAFSSCRGGQSTEQKFSNVDIAETPKHETPL